MSAIVRCIHDESDDRPPFMEGAAHVPDAQAADQDALLLQVDGDHFSTANPSATSWPTFIAALEDLTQ